MQNYIKNVSYLPIGNIYPNIYQPRKYFDEEALGELAQSIKVYGILQPLTVRKMSEDKYELVAGERRLRAAKIAGLENVPAVIVDIADRDSAALALLENLQREDLNYIEEAEAYNNLIREHGYTQEQLAEYIGKKQSTIANKLRLLKLDHEVRNVLLNNNLTERHARALLKLENEDSQLKILQVVIKDSLNVKKTEELIEKQYFIENDYSKDGKKRIKGVFSSLIYLNTIKGAIKTSFDKFGVEPKYASKELDDSIQITITIPKNK